MEQPPTILIIEDNDTLRDQVAQILELEDFRVHTAPNGREGLRLVRELQPDLVLCDIAMPEMDGHETLRAVRALHQGSLTPFIFLTARVSKDDRREGMDLGADDYLTKPFSDSELLRAVRSRLQRSASVARAAKAAEDALRSNLLLALPHEVRTPLNGIIGFAELLRDDWDDLSSEERREMLDHLIASGRRLERTATNLFQHLQLELAARSDTAADRYATDAATPAVDTIRDLVERLGRAQGRTIGLAVDTTATGTLVTPEPPVYRKMVEELLDNACKFSAPAGHVRVQVRADDREVVVTIEDDGVGMRPEQLEQVAAFRQFERKVREQQGLGLGLPIVLRLAEFTACSLRLSAGRERGIAAELRVPRSASPA